MKFMKFKSNLTSHSTFLFAESGNPIYFLQVSQQIQPGLAYIPCNPPNIDRQGFWSPVYSHLLILHIFLSMGHKITCSFGPHITIESLTIENL